MINVSVWNKQSDARVRILRAAILSAPFWSAGMLFLAVLFSLAHDGSFGSLHFVALSLILMLGSIVAALRMTDHDLELVNAKRAPEHRSMKMRSRRLRGVKLI